ncbi:hypothetical protein [Vitiosangium sp. GDMCC 1.1324]|uniref:hypothetical protein n=1 Tax=Vitiosangium sp. (strain GDMCC 1.1324) TaxID=2138576 RepID=UPI00130DEE02|nr:hypothetical protein [Vitiosangium sp. GDMCC 1.1324]
MLPKNDETESTEQEVKTQGATTYVSNGGHNEPPVGVAAEPNEASGPANPL